MHAGKCQRIMRVGIPLTDSSAAMVSLMKGRNKTQHKLYQKVEGNRSIKYTAKERQQ